MKTLTRPAPKRLVQPELTPNFWLGYNLQKLRRAKELTQEKLAKISKVSVRVLRDAETAVPGNNPELDTISKLARALGVEVAVLFKHDAKAEAEAAQFEV
jgi:transcriptional regulator with XRE-family HTH domain